MPHALPDSDPEVLQVAGARPLRGTGGSVKAPFFLTRQKKTGFGRILRPRKAERRRQISAASAGRYDL